MGCPRAGSLPPSQATTRAWTSTGGISAISSIGDFFSKLVIHFAVCSLSIGNPWVDTLRTAFTNWCPERLSEATATRGERRPKPDLSNLNASWDFDIALTCESNGPVARCQGSPQATASKEMGTCARAAPKSIARPLELFASPEQRSTNIDRSEALRTCICATATAVNPLCHLKLTVVFFSYCVRPAESNLVRSLRNEKSWRSHLDNVFSDLAPS